MPNEMNDKNVFFIHSKCCDAHWELVYFAGANKRYKLQCEECGKPVGGDIRVAGPLLEKPKCARCGDENCNNDCHDKPEEECAYDWEDL